MYAFTTYTSLLESLDIADCDVVELGDFLDGIIAEQILQQHRRVEAYVPLPVNQLRVHLCERLERLDLRVQLRRARLVTLARGLTLAGWLPQLNDFSLELADDARL